MNGKIKNLNLDQCQKLSRKQLLKHLIASVATKSQNLRIVPNQGIFKVFLETLPFKSLVGYNAFLVVCDRWHHQTFKIVNYFKEVFVLIRQYCLIANSVSELIRNSLSVQKRFLDMDLREKSSPGVIIFFYYYLGFFQD